MRKPILAGNWKMNLTTQAAVELVTAIKRELNDSTEVDIVVCPVYTVLDTVHDVLMESNIKLGAQNLYWEDAGAFTGEISAPLLKDVGVQYVIIGHSERRQYFGETNETVNKKIKAALSHDLSPIVCVGEVLAERESGQTQDVVKTQLAGSLAGLSSEQISRLVIAYEPVWAIGTGKTATPQQAQEVHAFIRQWIKANFNEEIAANLRIQYGGSVKPSNVKDLMTEEDIDGGLVGGASLKSDSFIELVKNAV